MTDAANLAEAQALHADALALVRGDVARLQAALAEKPIGQRLRDDALNTATQAAERVADVALDNKPVLITMALALIGWSFRRQLGALVQTLRRT
ncbi:hypothetical protein [Novosphingobium sp. FKTRR1]|uniref:hypothetical protein n=1 Tax=unclassified Novosphingobium TaxID=2644732 RepID=UPI001CF0030D|nr:hypothetical protein [Novosphingobium sp. FKTRR1]